MLNAAIQNDSNMTVLAKKNDLQLWQSLGLARSGSRSLRNLIRSTRPDHRGPIHTRISNHTHIMLHYTTLITLHYAN